MPSNRVLSERLARALVQAILLWCWNEEIPVQRPLGEKWFRDFVRRWGVARTMFSGHLRKALTVLNRGLQVIRQGEEGETVQQIARQLKSRKISPGQAVSLVSKIAYFLEPERFAPFDRYARDGLNRYRDSGSPRIKPADYAAYLRTFDEHFKRMEAHIIAACEQPWARELVRRLGHPREVLDATGFRRKVFDNLLMLEGGRWPKNAQPNAVAAKA